MPDFNRTSSASLCMGLGIAIAYRQLRSVARYPWRIAMSSDPIDPTGVPSIPPDAPAPGPTPGDVPDVGEPEPEPDQK
jgi:hypothetical protein